MDQPQKIIGLDMDGVLIDHTQLKIKVAAKFGVGLNPAQTPADVMVLTVPDLIRHQLQDIIYDDPTLSYQSPLMEGATAVLAILQKRGLPFKIISRRRHPEHAWEILSHHQLLPNYFKREDIHFVSGKEAKNGKAIELGVTHYIDDEQRVLEVMPDVPNRFLFDQFHIAQNCPYICVSSLAEFVEKI